MMKLTCGGILAALALVATARGLTPTRRGLAHRGGSHRASSRAAPRMGYSKVFVAGGSKGVGRDTVQQLLAAGKDVVALVRSDEAEKDIKDLGATPIRGDAFTYKDVESAMDGCDAVVTTMGGKTDDRLVDYDGNKNVVEAAGILGVTRVVLVTSIGCGDSKKALSDQTYQVLKEYLEAKEKVEAMLKKFYSFSTDWTVIRPGGLVTDEPTGNAILTEDESVSGIIRRSDVASLILKVLEDKDSFKKIYSAVDPTIERQ